MARSQNPHCRPRRHDESNQQGNQHRSAGADRNGPHVRPPQTTDESHGQDGRHNRERGEDGRIANFVHCLDRHLTSQPNKVAIVFEADDGSVTKITYKQLYHRVCQFANGLKSLGIKIGDRVIIYMPMSIEVVIAMQACARIGAVHSVVFGGFSAESLRDRINDILTIREWNART